MTSIHICSFSAGLGDLTRKEQGNPEIVLDIIRRRGRFSAFDASANQVIARTVTMLQRHRLTVDPDSQYPWVKVTAIDGVPLTIQEAETR